MLSAGVTGGSVNASSSPSTFVETYFPGSASAFDLVGIVGRGERHLAVTYDYTPVPLPAALPLPVAPLGNLGLSSSWWDTATGQTPTTVTGDGSYDGTLPGLVNDLSANAASTYMFSHGFTAPSGSDPDIQINDASQGAENIGFIDSYVFAITASNANAFAFSLNLSSSSGLQDLTVRLYEYSANGVQNLTLGGTGAVATAQTVDNWSLSSNPNGSGIASTSIPVSNLGTGEYVLEIAGLETGTSNGAYSGQLDIAPVPVPAALPLLLSGLAGLGFKIRRR